MAYIMTHNPDPAATQEEQKKQIIEVSPFIDDVKTVEKC